MYCVGSEAITSAHLVEGSVDLVDSDVPIGLDVWRIKHSQEKPVV